MDKGITWKTLKSTVPTHQKRQRLIGDEGGVPGDGRWYQFDVPTFLGGLCFVGWSPMDEEAKTYQNGSARQYDSSMPHHAKSTCDAEAYEMADDEYSGGDG